jgi:single-stranded-DNA-specific exonuclease
VAGFELHTALAACGEHLEAHGGHAQAAGLTVSPERFPAFQKAFHSYVEEQLSEEARTPTLDVDALAEVDDLTPALAASLERLEPFGRGNPEPVLGLKGVQVAGNPRRMGQNADHISFHVGRNGHAIRCVAFRKADLYEPVLRRGAPVDVAFTPQRNTFRGRTDLEARVVDLRPA